VAQVAAVLKRGVAELDPQVAIVTASTCDGCGMCVDACPFAAITMMGEDGARFAAIDPTGCKGCGACVPVCPVDAIDLAGYTDVRIRGMIDALATGPAR
jgi:heterodisulfide reductase subunit A